MIHVQHHHAHIASCLAENGVDEEVLGIAWDGTGHGPDGTVWGGEFLLATQGNFSRLGSLRSFPLPGGEKAIREPRLAALGALREAGIPVENTPLAAAFQAAELRIAESMLSRQIHSPRTTSAGRLFDAVAALAGLRHCVSFEGQAAIELENALPADAASFPGYDLPPALGDWRPVLTGVVADLGRGVPLPRISTQFHNAMAGMIVQAALTAGRGKVALSGGCFQNRYLLEQSILRLRMAGFEPVWHRQVPPNDGGLALGQAVVAARHPSLATQPCV